MTDKPKGCWWVVWEEFDTPAGRLDGGEYKVEGATDPDDSAVARSMVRTMAEMWGDHYHAEWRAE